MENKYQCSHCNGTGNEPEAGSARAVILKIDAVAEYFEVQMNELLDLGHDFTVSMGDAVDDLRKRSIDLKKSL